MPNQVELKKPRPWHLWAVGVVSLLWNAFGCFDYTMMQTRNEAYLAAFTAEQRAYFESFPAWMEAFWALGVWGALAGSIALLFASRHAVMLFALSLLGLLVSTVWQLGFASTKPSSIAPYKGLAGNVAGVMPHSAHARPLSIR